MPVLQDRYRLVVPDLRGHGWTDASPDGDDEEQLATDLDGDPLASGALLQGWRDCADDMALEWLPGLGHFLPEEAPDLVADRVRALFG